jgi:LysR family nitrogen assimilation transcriptional regulator
LSHHIRALEAEFGLQLIVRGSRGIQVTDAGARLVREATDLFEITRLLPERVRQDDNALEGGVTVAFGQSIGSRVVAPLLALAAKRLPNIRLDIREHMSSHLPNAVRSGVVDFGLSYDTRNGSGLQVRKLTPEDVGLTGTPGLAARFLGRPLPKKVSFEKLAALPLFLTLRSNHLRELIETACQKSKVTLKVVTDVDSMHFLREIARNGVGFTILPKSNLDFPYERGHLWWAPLVDPRIAQDICLVFRSGRPMSKAAAAVCELATEVLLDR